MDDRGIRQTGSRFCRLSAVYRVIDRVVDLIADELNSARRSELVQTVQFGIADRSTGRIVRTVNQDQLGISIRQALDLVHIDAETFLSADGVVANLDSKGFGQSGKWWITRLRQHNVGPSFRGQPKENQQCLRGASDDLDRFDINLLHLGDGGA